MDVGRLEDILGRLRENPGMALNHQDAVWLAEQAALEHVDHVLEQRFGSMLAERLQKAAGQLRVDRRKAERSEQESNRAWGLLERVRAAVGLPVVVHSYDDGDGRTDVWEESPAIEEVVHAVEERFALDRAASD